MPLPAYSYCQQFAEWTKEDVNFVCRLKEKASTKFQEVLFEKTLEKGAFSGYKIEHVYLKYKKEKREKPLCLRPVYYRDEQGGKYKFITNDWEISAEEVALIYKYRWTIELIFKKLKQNIQLHFFYSETENGIKIHILCTLIAHLLLNVIRALSKSEKAFSTAAALLATNTPDKSFGLDLGSNRRQTILQKIGKTQK
jgi:transposase